VDVRQAACQMGQRAPDGFMALGFDDAPGGTSFHPPLPTLRQAGLGIDLNLQLKPKLGGNARRISRQELGEHYFGRSLELLL
jgi:hypothetical protein